MEVEYFNLIVFCYFIDEYFVSDSVLIGDGGDFVVIVLYMFSLCKLFGWFDFGVFGILGVGVGFVIGVKLVNFEFDVWLFYGDGVVGFSLMEMDMFVCYGFSVVFYYCDDVEIVMGECVYFY